MKKNMMVDFKYTRKVLGYPSNNRTYGPHSEVEVILEITHPDGEDQPGQLHLRIFRKIDNALFEWYGYVTGADFYIPATAIAEITGTCRVWIKEKIGMMGKAGLKWRVHYNRRRKNQGQSSLHWPLMAAVLPFMKLYGVNFEPTLAYRIFELHQMALEQCEVVDGPTLEPCEVVAEPESESPEETTRSVPVNDPSEFTFTFIPKQLGWGKRWRSRKTVPTNIRFELVYPYPGAAGQLCAMISDQGSDEWTRFYGFITVYDMFVPIQFVEEILRYSRPWLMRKVKDLRKEKFTWIRIPNHRNSGYKSSSTSHYPVLTTVLDLLETAGNFDREIVRVKLGEFYQMVVRKGFVTKLTMPDMEWPTHSVSKTVDLGRPEVVRKQGGTTNARSGTQSKLPLSKDTATDGITRMLENPYVADIPVSTIGSYLSEVFRLLLPKTKIDVGLETTLFMNELALRLSGYNSVREFYERKFHPEFSHLGLINGLTNVPFEQLCQPLRMLRFPKTYLFAEFVDELIRVKNRLTDKDNLRLEDYIMGTDMICRKVAYPEDSEVSSEMVLQVHRMMRQTVKRAAEALEILDVSGIKYYHAGQIRMQLFQWWYRQVGRRYPELLQYLVPEHMAVAETHPEAIRQIVISTGFRWVAPYAQYFKVPEEKLYSLAIREMLENRRSKEPAFSLDTTFFKRCAKQFA